MDRRDDREPPLEANEDDAELREDDIGIRDQRWTAEEEAEGGETGTDLDEPSAAVREAELDG